MADDTANLIIEHLRALRAGQDDIRVELKEIKTRINHLEGVIIGQRRDVTLQQEDIYAQNLTIDRIKERLDRIEKRLELS